jgi:hypothetical protein
MLKKCGSQKPRSAPNFAVSYPKHCIFMLKQIMQGITVVYGRPGRMRKHTQMLA